MDMDSRCRFCLLSKFVLIPIFNENIDKLYYKIDFQESIPTMVEQCIGLKLTFRSESDDTLFPMFACRDCLKELKKASDFRELSLKSGTCLDYTDFLINMHPRFHNGKQKSTEEKFLECGKSLKKLCMNASNENDALIKKELIEIDNYDIPSWIPMELVKDACKSCYVKLLKAVNFQSLCEKSDAFLRAQNKPVVGNSDKPYQFSGSTDEEANCISNNGEPLKELKKNSLDVIQPENVHSKPIEIISLEQRQMMRLKNNLPVGGVTESSHDNIAAALFLKNEIVEYEDQDDEISNEIDNINEPGEVSIEELHTIIKLLQRRYAIQQIKLGKYRNRVNAVCDEEYIKSMEKKIMRTRRQIIELKSHNPSNIISRYKTDVDGDDEFDELLITKIIQSLQLSIDIELADVNNEDNFDETLITKVIQSLHLSIELELVDRGI